MTHLSFGSLLIDTDDASVLCDPWLVDGAYYGAWAHYPPPPFDPEEFDHVDYIYLSDRRPHHFDPATLSRIDDDVPVLVLDHADDRLRDAVAGLGFEVIELPPGRRTRLAGNTHVNVLAADGPPPEPGVDPRPDGETPGATPPNSIAVVDDGQFTLVDAGDLPHSAEPVCRTAKDEYGEIDLLAHQYAAPSFYPQAVTDFDHGRKLRERNRLLREQREFALRLVDVFEPSYYLPFAGEYVLAGRLARLNEYTANPSRRQVRETLETRVDDDHECLFLNAGEFLDLDAGERSTPFRPLDPVEKRRYVREELADRPLDYETDPVPTLGELQTYVPYAFENLETMRARVDFATETSVLVSARDDVYLHLPLDGAEPTYVIDPALDDYDARLKIEVDPRLLRRLLAGPSSATWADARRGSHLGIESETDIPLGGLFDCLQTFHADGYDVTGESGANDVAVRDRLSAE